MKLAAPCLARHSSPARSMVIILTSRAQMHTARTGSSCVGRGLPFGSASASFPGFENACPATVYWGLSPSSSKSILPRHVPNTGPKWRCDASPASAGQSSTNRVICMRPLGNRRRCHPYQIAQLDAGGSQHVPHPFYESEPATPANHSCWSHHCALRGRPMYAINPLAVSRYRERHTVARAKSDHVDAVVLANILRTDADAHRLLPSDSELVQAIAVLARGGQDAAWSRQQIMNQLRSILREYFPAALCAFKDQRAGLAAAEARTILAAAPTPGAAARLTKARLRRLLLAAGRQRNIDARIDQLLTVFASGQMRQLPRVEAAFGEQTKALLLQLDVVCRAVDHLAQATEEAFSEHPDARILTSFPGVGTLTGRYTPKPTATPANEISPAPRPWVIERDAR
jgi:hypothetical protein